MATKPKTSKAPTIQDIATRAGVSVSAVSHVLNGNTQRVGPEKRARVLEIVRELNYRPNAIARSMARRKTTTVGLVVDGLDSPTHTAVIKGVEEVLRTAGYHIVLANVHNADDEEMVTESLRAQQVDGVVFMLTSRLYPAEYLYRLRAEGVPFVVINRPIKERSINQVLFDDHGAGYTATKHMIDLGHKRIGMISGPLGGEPTWHSAIERYRGWRDALHEHQLNSDPRWMVVGDYTVEDGYRAAKQLIAQWDQENERPTALFVGGGSMAVATLKALHEAGLRMPHDIAVITIDDLPLSAFTYPALTTLALPLVEAGRVATRLLVEWLNTGAPSYGQTITLSCNLLIRESCGAYLRSTSHNDHDPS